MMKVRYMKSHQNPRHRKGSLATWKICKHPSEPRVSSNLLVKESMDLICSNPSDSQVLTSHFSQDDGNLDDEPMVTSANPIHFQHIKWCNLSKEDDLITRFMIDVQEKNTGPTTN